jgi:hypothetical protein
MPDGESHACGVCLLVAMQARIPGHCGGTRVHNC